jgi:zinc transporter, ZIP family
VLAAAGWGLVGGGALVLGAGIGLLTRPSQRLIALVMAFGAGVLISALTFELTEEAFKRGGAVAVAGGLAAGALAFFAADWVVDRRGGANRKRSGGEQSAGSASAIAIGALMDGIPESAAIGLTLIEGGGVGVAVVTAVFLSNMPESISAAVGLRRAGRRPSRILAMWVAVALVSGLAAALGYGLLDSASPALVGAVQAFAAGAILTMLADTMMPEAFEHGGGVVGLVTVAGFAAAYLLSSLA